VGRACSTKREEEKPAWIIGRKARGKETMKKTKM
jgi:hypothetical protein